MLCQCIYNDGCPLSILTQGELTELLPSDNQQVIRFAVAQNILLAHKRRGLCRWGRERYEGAVGALVHILRYMQATQPDACVLRPTLREEARKAIGVWTPSHLELP